MQADLVLLESMGRIAQGQMHKCQRDGVGECDHQHCVRCLDAWSRYLPAGSPPNALEEEGWSWNDVCGRNIVSLRERP